MPARSLEDVLRHSAPLALGALVRHHGHFDRCEDAVQEALLAAATQWPRQGVPDEPVAWLVTVAGRRLTDRWRSEAARRQREHVVAEETARNDASRVGASGVGASGVGTSGGGVSRSDEPGSDPACPDDDTLQLLLLCTHPALSEPSRIALTLRAVGGLTTAEIARAFLVPETTMGQRISRAKATIADAGGTFPTPAQQAHDERLAAALHVLYLIFTEGSTATSGPALTRLDLTAEAIRLTRRLHTLLPEDGEITGLLALMLLTDARRDTRTAADGSLVPLPDQDRTRWDAEAITEATTMLERSLAEGSLGPYQLQAAIAAVHAEAPTDDATDWAQIATLYGLLERRTANPVVTLNRAVAVGMVEGPTAGLALLDAVAADARLRRSHRPDAVRAHLLERLGERAGAAEAYRRAARAALNQTEKRYLERKAVAVAE